MACLGALSSICRKTRRRGDKGDGSGSDGEEQKLYLQEPLLETRVPPEPDLTFLTDLPGGLDFNEWLASHSEFNKNNKQNGQTLRISL